MGDLERRFVLPGRARPRRSGRLAAGGEHREVPDVVTVVVPAHDEVDHLAPCLRSIDRAALEVAATVRVVVVLDACSDGTHGVVPAGVEVVEVGHRNVGRARAAGFGYAARAAGTAAGTGAVAGWYATTDADCEVPTDWLAAHLDAAATADVFVGTVEVQDWSPRTPSLATRYEAGYRHTDGHPHVHGANVGLTADAYWQVGGFAPLTSAEDVDLVHRLVAAGLVVHRSGAAPVVTSARRSARTPDGFSAHLGALEQELTA